jgi:hypothetical protein
VRSTVEMNQGRSVNVALPKCSFSIGSATARQLAPALPKGRGRDSSQSRASHWQLGNATGAAVGLGALLAISSTAFSVVKYAGALYLVYLGLRVLCPGRREIRRDERVPTCSRLIFRDGFVVALLNPKTAVFFAAFLPQFMKTTVDPILQTGHAGHTVCPDRDGRRHCIFGGRWRRRSRAVACARRDDRRHTWATAFRLLRPGGVFIVDVRVPHLATLAEAQRVRPRAFVDLDIDATRRTEGKEARLLRCTATTYESHRQRGDVRLLYDRFEQRALAERLVTDFASHIYFPAELELLFVSAGFEIAQQYGDYRFVQVDRTSPYVVTVARQPRRSTRRPGGHNRDSALRFESRDGVRRPGQSHAAD